MKYQNFNEVLAISPSPLVQKTLTKQQECLVPKDDIVLKALIDNVWEVVSGVYIYRNKGAYYIEYYSSARNNILRLYYAPLCTCTEFEVVHCYIKSNPDHISDYDRAMSIL